MTMRLCLKRVCFSDYEPPLNVGGLHHPPAIHDLPPETLLAILSYLSHADLTTTVPDVCRRWRQFHNDPSLYSRLSFTADDPVTTSAAVALLERAPWLKHLSVDERSDANELLRRVKSGNRLLESLTMHYCHGTPVRKNVSSICLRNMLRRCTRLQRLSLKGTGCCGRVFYTEIGLQLSGLRNVNFGPAKSVTAAALANIVDNCIRLEEVRAFTLTEKTTDAQISDEICINFCNRFFDSLRVVKLNFAACSDASVKSLARCRNLTKLHLYNAQLMTDHGFSSLSTLPRLECLTVSQADRVTTGGWLRFFDTATTQSYRKLSLFRCDGVDDGVATAVGTHMRRLTVLWLVGCNGVTSLGHDVVRRLLPYNCKYLWW